MFIKPLATAGLLSLATLTLAACQPGNHESHGTTTGDHAHDTPAQGHMNHQNLPTHQHGGPFAASHQRMMDDMHQITLSGDVDHDFVRGMIPHHQGAIDMAEVLLAQGSDAQLLDLAEEIISAQRAEIQQMEQWLAEYGPARPGPQQDQIRAGYDQINQTMMRDMDIAPTGDVDRDFVLGMIPHHEAAIDMARLLLEYSDNQELRELAEAVIREQEREIHFMHTWLESKPLVTGNIRMHSDPNCGCCGDWAAHLDARGYNVLTDHSADLFELKAERGIPSQLRSCHTALVDGYVVEGHVPVEAIEAFLGMTRKPFGERTVGISVPGMPHGSPGMETGHFDDYDVVAFTADGETAVIHEVRF